MHIRYCTHQIPCATVSAPHTLYHAQVLLLPLRPRGVRMQSPARAADTPLAQTTCALKPIVERGGERLVRPVRVRVGVAWVRAAVRLGLECWALGNIWVRG